MIGSDGSQLGVMDTRDALRKAEDEGLDLVEVARNESPPVCRIMDFGKYMYDEKKKRRESRKRQSRVEVKQCKFRPKIGDHDFDVRIRSAVKFLAQGNKVKLTVMFRGREHAHPEVAERLLLRAFDAVKDLGKIESPPRKEGRDMHCLISPLPEEVRKKAVKAREQAQEQGKKAEPAAVGASVGERVPDEETEPGIEEDESTMDEEEDRGDGETTDDDEVPAEEMT